MSSNPDPSPDSCQHLVYQLRVKGHLEPRWADWFEGMTVTAEDNGDTLVTGPVIDQAALHAVLKRVRDLGLPLLSVMRVEANVEGEDVPLPG